MKSNISLNDDTRREVGRILNLILAREYVLYATARDCHRNVTGPESLKLRRQFASECRRIGGWIDAVGEHARAIAIGARGHWVGLSSLSGASDDFGIDQSGEQRCAELLSLHEALAAQLRLDREVCAVRYRDDGTACFLAGLSEQHERAASLLRAELEPELAELFSDQPLGLQRR